jgi:hypothetical protein
MQLFIYTWSKIELFLELNYVVLNIVSYIFYIEHAQRKY